MTESAKPEPAAGGAAGILADIAVAYTSARAKHPLEGDRRAGGVHRLVVEAGHRVRSGCIMYHREGLIEAAGLLISAIEVLDLSGDTPHDCTRRK